MNRASSVDDVAIDQHGDRILVTSLDGDAAIMDSAGNKIWTNKTDRSWAHCAMTKKGDSIILVSDKGEVVCYKTEVRRDKKASGRLGQLRFSRSSDIVSSHRSRLM